MSFIPECYYEQIGLLLLSLALFLSMCLNVTFCIRRRASMCNDADETNKSEGEGLSQDEGHYFHDLNHREQQENPHNHHEQQENPIYGNISIDRRVSVEVCYEMMTKQQIRDRMQPLDPDLNYASLDLKVAKKRKKHRHQQGQTQGQSNCQDQLPVRLTPPVSDFLEVERDMNAHLPSRDTSIMVSHSSIYLNSQQIAQETEEMERERESICMERENVSREGMRRREEVGSRKAKREQESEDIKDDDGSGTVCARLSQTDLCNSSINHDSDQHD